MIETLIFTFGCVIGLSIGLFWGHKSGYSKGFANGQSELRTETLLDTFVDQVSRSTPMNPQKFVCAINVVAPNHLFEPDWNRYTLEAARLNCRQSIIEQLDQAGILTADVQEQPALPTEQTRPRKTVYRLTLAVVASKYPSLPYEKPKTLASISSAPGCKQHV